MAAAAQFPIVGVGASAGGVEALEGFFRGLPERPGLAVVVVTHLSPERESVLHEIIARYTTMPVHVATDAARVQPESVYVLPADAVLSIELGRLMIRRLVAGRRERKPIDIFFSALAADQGEFAAGVVLSGGDGDGTLGVKAIKERGGLTLAQVADGFGPNHPSMPSNAIASGFIDLALPAEEMGAKLVEFAQGMLVLADHDGDVELDAARAGAGAASAPGAIELALPDISLILRVQLGHDFSGYKTKTFVRRVQRRMQVAGLRTVENYVEHLRQDPDEVRALFRDLLINVTNFFRDGEAFEALAAQVVPKLFEGRGENDTVRVWVPGCSTGEEVFSLGILLREHMDGLAAPPQVQLFATDIDERALAVARAARFPAALFENVSDGRRQRFFVADGGSYLVAKEVRDLCIFSPHSVIRDPPFSRIDLVSCRNLLIYFGTDVQNQVIPTLHYALRPDGYLFLGTSETVSAFDDLFAPLDKHNRIFQRRAGDGGSRRPPMLLSRFRGDPALTAAPRRPSQGASAMRELVDSQVIERFAPAHVVTTREGDVIYYSARTGKYLEPAPGSPSRQLLTMARKGLRLDLRATFREAVESGRLALREGVAVEIDDGRVQMVRVSAEPLGDRGAEPLFLVLFADEGPTLTRDEARSRADTVQAGSTAQLERELRDTRERLQSIIEEYETALEELKSSNEELVSVNEELQSTNEELEASKEELQSLNEELNTVNGELNGKIDALDLANADLENLFDSTDVATIFLDRKLVIRSFTPAMTGLFSILPSDRGRPITDLASRFELPSFLDDLREVLDGRALLERRVGLPTAGTQFLLRLIPYRYGGPRTAGVVLSFVDVTRMVQAEARQFVLIAELQHRTRNLLAIVQSIAQQTLGRGAAMEAFSMRLSALGRVQGLISQAEGARVDLGEIVRQEMQALGSGDDGRVEVSGPPVSLELESVQAFALALHELATNALKYGALRTEGGYLRVSWAVTPDAEGRPVLVLDWRETGVAVPPGAEARRGYGRELIERALRFTLGARADLTFAADGVSCRIELPLRDYASAMVDAVAT